MHPLEQHHFCHISCTNQPVAAPEAAAEEAPNPKPPKLGADCPDAAAAAGWLREKDAALDAAGWPKAGAA